MSEQLTNPQETNGSPELKQKLGSLYVYLAQKLGIKSSPSKVVFTKNIKNAENPFGLTGYYDQKTRIIRLYVTDRHETDILRSFAHEIIHHWQNERGTLNPVGKPEPAKSHYAQTDSNLRRREMEAYLFGNILFRDWQDENRYGPPSVQPVLPQPLDENLELSDGRGLRLKVQEFVKQLIGDGVLNSRHRKLTSGDMDPSDFAEDLQHKLISSIEEWIQTVNNRGNWENQSDMIKENNVVCQNCGHGCNYSQVGECCMGAIKCPNCKMTMNQEGIVYGG
jgi:hypothetical protein